MTWSGLVRSGYYRFVFLAFLPICFSSSAVLSEADVLEMAVKVGSEFKVSLESNPTTGYKWEAKVDENLLKIRSDSFHRVPEARIGQGGRQAFVFLPINAGETVIEFLYKRSWEKEPLQQKQYKIIIKR